MGGAPSLEGGQPHVRPSSPTSPPTVPPSERPHPFMVVVVGVREGEDENTDMDH